MKHMQAFPQKLSATILLLFIARAFLFSQCIKGDCLEGQGIYIYKDHTIYIGQFSNQKANGFGTCYYSSGAKYSGFWRDHAYHGKGTYFYPDGVVEFGEWANGKMNQAQEWIDSTAGRAPISWAVVVGVSNYKHLKPLHYTDDDAYRVMAFLQSPKGGAIEDEHLKILVDDGATRANIIQGLHEIVRKIGAKDQLIFYFSGHGFEDAFAPIDYDGNLYKLYHQEVLNIVKNASAQNKLCIVDACFSGSMENPAILKSKVSTDIKNAYFQKFVEDEQQTSYIFSSQAEEASIEHRGLRQGVFSYFLLKGLKGEADANEDGKVTVQEISAYLETAVSTYTNNYQRPIILNGNKNATVISELNH